MTSERFRLNELPTCMCGMRLFEVIDTVEETISVAHVGSLNPHDKGHDIIRNLLRAERERAKSHD